MPEFKKEDLLKKLVAIANIPSPTGFEQQKIQFIKTQLQKMQIKNTFIDPVGNCIAKLPSRLNSKNKKTILVVAHADTACDPGKNHQILEDAKYLYGHGICDNSAGVLSTLTAISLIKQNSLAFPNNLIFSFTVGEEGLGAKKGMKQVIKDYGKQIDAVINVESHHLGRVTNQVIGQYRCRLSVDTDLGGHSFRDFGRPNANVIIAKIISDFSKYHLPQKKGKTTYNFGLLQGDGSINAIAKSSSCLFEIRSENNNYLQKTREKFAVIVKKHQKQQPDVRIKVEVTAEVDAAILSSSHKIYQLTMAIQKQLGIIPKIDAGNTDGDVSLIQGIPTVTIGVI